MWIASVAFGRWGLVTGASRYQWRSRQVHVSYRCYRFPQREPESLTGVVSGQEPCQDISQFVVTQKSRCFDLFTISPVLYVQRRLCQNFWRAPVHKRDEKHTLFYLSRAQITKETLTNFSQEFMAGFPKSKELRIEISLVWLVSESVLQGRLCRIFDRN